MLLKRRLDGSIGAYDLRRSQFSTARPDLAELTLVVGDEGMPERRRVGSDQNPRGRDRTLLRR